VVKKFHSYAGGKDFSASGIRMLQTAFDVTPLGIIPFFNPLPSRSSSCHSERAYHPDAPLVILSASEGSMDSSATPQNDTTTPQDLPTQKKTPGGIGVFSTR